ncbi:TMEM175 family protein [Pseudomonadota bacterium]
MAPLTQEFVDKCPVEGGFRMRGLEMTRIEVFVDAAFAFAVTMLVISFDAIPTSFPEIVLAIKGIPAFIVAVVQLVWIWYTHNKWSRRYGLDTALTVVLSTALLIVVLIYVYPMRIMAQGMFSWFTSGYLSTSFSIDTTDELAAMFIFLGIGFVSMCLVFVLMYRYAGSLKKALLLNDFESYETKTLEYMWLGAAGIGVLCIVLALLLPRPLVPFSGFAFALLGAWFPLIRSRRKWTKSTVKNTVG